MKSLKLTGKELKSLIIAGSNYLQQNKTMVDELNVFPVPDGDTGTNMSLTVLSAAKEIEKVTSDSLFEVAKAAASGSLRGARGNSGVILSQLFRGFSKGLEGQTELNLQVLANAFKEASETAYKAVMKPKEGTILTVAREIAEKAGQIAPDNIEIDVFFEQLLRHGNEVLKRTPDMLPVLKQAGVVDAGGKGLICILEGAYFSLIGKNIDVEIEAPEEEEKTLNSAFEEFKTEDIAFGYCTEFIIHTKDVTPALMEEIRVYMEAIGDSLVVVEDEDLIKIHVHTDHPGQALEKALSIGPLTNMKIENMREQHTHNLVKHRESQAVQDRIDSQEEEQLSETVNEYGFISVAAGEGLVEIFEKLGAEHVIRGGQTMNPSIEDFLNVIQKMSAKHIFILPNNKNIILAAEQAKELTDKSVFIIPTKSIPQGLSSMIQFNSNRSPEENFDRMIKSLRSVKTGQITFAVRDTNIDGLKIKTNDIMGILEDKIEVVTQNLEETTKLLLDKMIANDTEILSVYYGKDVSKEEAEKLQSYVEDHYENCEIEVYYGGQPLYYYIISAE